MPRFLRLRPSEMQRFPSVRDVARTELALLFFPLRSLMPAMFLSKRKR